MKGLILIPTVIELERIGREFRSQVADHGWSIELCGFGPIASASRSALLIEQRKPDHVLLLGIAGTFSDTLPIGTAAAFDQICCYGVGVGLGEQYQSAADLGFRHWNEQGLVIDDCLDLQNPNSDTTDRRVLLTSSSASANKSEAAQKLTAVPDAVAEDMEGFSVAVSCRLAQVPLTIIRGISNDVGDRDQQDWRIGEALEAAANVAIEQVIARPR